MEPTGTRNRSEVLAQAERTALRRDSIAALARVAAIDELRAALATALDESRIAAATALALAIGTAGGRIPAAAARQLLPDLELITFLPMIAGTIEGDRVAALLDVVEEERLSWEREALALYLATQLLEGAEAPPRLVSILRSLAREPLGPEAGMFVAAAGRVLGNADICTLASDWIPLAITIEKDGSAEDLRRFLFAPLSETLPEQEPARMVTGYTVTRAEPKVGRNDPCPCGSGKKYKKCCAAREHESFGRDRAIDEFRKLGPQPSRTREQIFELMRPGELAQLDPASLTTLELIRAARKLATHRRWEVAERFFDVLATRSDAPGNDPEGYRLELVDEALRAHALDFAERQLERMTLSERNQIRYGVQLSLAHNRPDALSQLESAAVAGLKDDESLLIESAYSLLEHFPALGILAARGTISAERFLDSEMLLDYVGRARDRLGLPAEEPWWKIFDFLLQENTERAERVTNDAESRLLQRELETLQADLAAANARAARLERDLSGRVAALDAMAAERERPSGMVSTAPTADDRSRVAELEAERQRLRNKIGELKGEIAEGTAQRAELRHKLAAASDAKRNASPAADVDERRVDEDTDDAVGDAVATHPRRILVPHFAPAATRALGQIPHRIAADALREVSSLAAGDVQTWNGAKHMKRAHDVLSVRVGRSYRLLFRVAEERLEVVDVIHRSELDETIERIARG